MSTTYETLKTELKETPKTWLVTGAAGFIGSHLTEELLKLGQRVVGLDNFATGHKSNLEDIEKQVGPENWPRFNMIEGDICNLKDCQDACKNVDLVLHQAALGSVPRSIADPAAFTEANVNGTLNMLLAARDSGVKRFVYASSSSVYGDSPKLPKVEDEIGQPLSPYALTKYIDEHYSRLFEKHYNFTSVGMRYFNVFGPRQDPNGAYAAVIPRWIDTMMRGESCIINGDGSTSRDFCFVKNVVQANLLAATTSDEKLKSRVFNIACHNQVSLLELFEYLRSALIDNQADLKIPDPEHGPFREGDVKHSLADISRVCEQLGYQAEYQISDGIGETVRWFFNKNT